MIQTVAVGFMFGKQFDELPVVDLDEREVDAAVGVEKRIWFFVTEKILIERARLIEVMDVKRDVRQSRDVRALRRFIRREQRECREQREAKENFLFHRILISDGLVAATGMTCGNSSQPGATFFKFGVTSAFTLHTAHAI